MGVGIGLTLLCEQSASPLACMFTSYTMLSVINIYCGYNAMCNVQQSTLNPERAAFLVDAALPRTLVAQHALHPMPSIAQVAANEHIARLWGSRGHIVIGAPLCMVAGSPARLRELLALYHPLPYILSPCADIHSTTSTLVEQTPTTTAAAAVAAKPTSVALWSSVMARMRAKSKTPGIAVGLLRDDDPTIRVRAMIHALVLEREWQQLAVKGDLRQENLLATRVRALLDRHYDRFVADLRSVGWRVDDGVQCASREYTLHITADGSDELEQPQAK
jgi:hypothetical protein